MLRALLTAMPTLVVMTLIFWLTGVFSNWDSVQEGFPLPFRGGAVPNGYVGFGAAISMIATVTGGLLAIVGTLFGSAWIYENTGNIKFFGKRK